MAAEDTYTIRIGSAADTSGFDRIDTAAENLAASAEAATAQMVNLQQALLRAQAAGDDGAAAELQQEITLRQEVARLAKQLGLAEHDAYAIAQERLTLAARIAAREQQTTEAAKASAQAERSAAQAAAARATELQKLTASADDFVQTLKLGVGIDLGGKLVNSLAAIPGHIQNAAQRGVAFNASISDAEVAIANVVGRFQGLNAEASKQEAAKAIAQIKAVEPEAAGSLSDLVQGFLATFAAAQSAGISIEQNVDLVGKFANALSNANIPASQLAQEMRSIVTGNINADSALARTLNITNEQVRAAKEAGNLYGFLAEKIGTLGTAGDTWAVSVSTLESAIDKALGDATRGIFDALKSSAADLATTLQDPATAEALQRLGIAVEGVVQTGIGLTEFALRNADTLALLATGVVGLGAALATIKFASILSGLGLKTAALFASKTATDAETASLAANTAAQVANTAARGGGTVATGAATATRAATAGRLGQAGLVVGAAVGGFAIGQEIERAIGLSDKLGESMTRRANAEANRHVAARSAVQSQILQADTLEKKTAARKALDELILKLSRDRTDAGQAELRIAEGLSARFDKLVGTGDKRLQQQKEQAAAAKAAADAAAAEASATVAAAAREEDSYKLLQAEAAGDVLAIAALERKLALEKEIAAVKKEHEGISDADAAKLADERITAGEIARNRSERDSALEQERQIGNIGKSASEVAQSDIYAARGVLGGLGVSAFGPGTDSDALLRQASALSDTGGQREKALEAVRKIKEAEQKITEEKSKQAQTEEEKQAKRQQALDEMQEELEINRAKAAGDEQEVARLERQREIKREIAWLEALGISASDAAARATEAVDARLAAAGVNGGTGAASAAGEASRPRRGRRFDISGRDVTDAAFDSGGTVGGRGMSQSYRSQLDGQTDFASAFTPRLGALVARRPEAPEGSAPAGDGAAGQIGKLAEKVGDAAGLKTAVEQLGAALGSQSVAIQATIEATRKIAEDAKAQADRVARNNG